jgi:hypothetical protein
VTPHNPPPTATLSYNRRHDYKIILPLVRKDDGKSYGIWQGVLKTKSGPFTFAVESGVTNGHPKPGALRTVKTLKKARAENAEVDITYTGPIVAGGKTLPHVVTRASKKSSAEVDKRSPTSASTTIPNAAIAGARFGTDAALSARAPG